MLNNNNLHGSLSYTEVVGCPETEVDLSRDLLKQSPAKGQADNMQSAIKKKNEKEQCIHVVESNQPGDRKNSSYYLL